MRRQRKRNVERVSVGEGGGEVGGGARFLLSFFGGATGSLVALASRRSTWRSEHCVAAA